MARKTSANLVDAVERLLEDSTNVIFSAANASSQLQECLSELPPWRIRVIKMAENSSKLGDTLSGHVGREIDISDIDKLRYVESIEYPVGEFPPSLRNWQEYNGMVFLNIGYKPSAAEQANNAGDTQYLTGTVTFTSASSAVTGSGTAFTSELEVGYYISKSGSSNWYRVASITDDTNLVLAINCAAADTGADTAGATRYWYEYVYLFIARDHYVEATQTDFAGAVNNASGYAENSWQMAVDALGTGTMPKDLLFTIAGVDGVYRITEDATITTNAATIKFSPRLKGRAENNAVVTFFCSSLTPQLEQLLIELTTARMAINWVGNARTAANNAITAYGLANTEVDKMATIISQANTDAGTARTAASANFTSATNAIAKAETSLNTDAEAALDKMSGDIETGLGANGATLITLLDTANTNIDNAVTDIGTARTALSGNGTAINTALTNLTAALTSMGTSLGSADDTINTLTIGNNPENLWMNHGASYASKASGHFGELQALIAEGAEYNPHISAALNAARLFITEVQGRIAVEAQLTAESLQEARDRIRLAYGSLAEARGYLEADTSKTLSLYRVIQAQLQAANTYLNTAQGYFNETSASLRTTTAFSSLANWGRGKLAEVQNEIRKFQKPRQKSYALSEY